MSVSQKFSFDWLIPGDFNFLDGPLSFFRTFFIDNDGQRWIDNLQEDRGDKSSRNRNGTEIIL